MSITIHTITRYTVQVLTKKAGKNAHSYVTLRLYDHENVSRGVAIFESYDGEEPPKPTGDFDDQSTTWFLDIALFGPTMDILRLEKQIYLKIGWTLQRTAQTVAQVSIDTKEEVIGQFFELSPRAS